VNQRITVIDAPCGAGKSSWAIQEIRSHPETAYIYCSPFLDELGRIREECGTWRMLEPNNFDSSKIEHFNRLLAEGKSVAVTHSTFLNATPETMEAIQNGNYTLIIDEALDIISEFNRTSIVEQSKEQRMTGDDIQVLLDGHYIEVNERTGLVHWAKPDYRGGKFSEVQRLASLDRLYLYGDTILICLFPPEIFSLFNSTYVLTYLFDGSILKPYFEAFQIEYKRASILRKEEDGSYYLDEYSGTFDIEFRQRCKELITRYWPDKARPEFDKTTLSKAWYERNHNKTKEVEKVRNKMAYFFRYIARASAGDIMWTCTREYAAIFAGKGYTTSHRITKEEKEKLSRKEYEKLEKGSVCFVPCNAKATNIYKERWALAYCCNMYPNTVLKNFFVDYYGIEMSQEYQDLFAVSNLVQWVLRSRLRDGLPIFLYILAGRMAKLFDRWLDGEI